jgi:hypothetical protein
VAVINALQTTPVLVWSERDFGKETISSTFAKEDLSRLISSVAATEPIEQGPFSKLKVGNGKPEVVVLYLQNQLRTDEIQSNSVAFAPLKRLLDAAKSSVIAPWLQIKSEDDSIDQLIVDAAEQYGRVFLVSPVKDSAIFPLLQATDATYQRVSQLELTQQAIFNNGQCELIIVELTGSNHGANNALVVELDNAIKAKTTNYVAIFTAQRTTPVEFNLETQAVDAALAQEKEHGYARRYVFQNVDVNDTTNGTTNGTMEEDWTVWFPYWFWEGLLFGIIFVWIAICGLSLLMSIQTHDRYLTETKLKLT